MPTARTNGLVSNALFSLGNKKVLMQNFDIDRNESELRSFDAAFYSRLYVASPFLAFAVANYITVRLELKDGTKCEQDDTWDALRNQSTKAIARGLDLPVQLLRKIPTSELASPALTEELAMLRKVIQKKPRCARWLRHAKNINLSTVRLMYMIDCDDAQLWAWHSELAPSEAGHFTDILVIIGNVLKQTGQRWQHGMVRDVPSLCYAYKKQLSKVRFPEPSFTDNPKCIEAIRTGTELSDWGLSQRNCAASYLSTCLTGDKIIYKMLWPSPATILICPAIDGDRPWLIDAKAKENGELDKDQLAVLLDWCETNGIQTRWWITEGAR